MKKWEIKYHTPNAGGQRPQSYTIEAKEKTDAENLFKLEFPLEEITSIKEVTQ